MSAKNVVGIKDLPREAQLKLLATLGRTRAPSQRSFTAEHERRFALRVCALVAELSQDQRRRVLSRALKVNAV